MIVDENKKAAWDASVAEKYTGQVPFRYIEDDPALPRVLLIGDSISTGYTETVRDFLVGKANVHRIPDNAGNSDKGVEQMDSWLGEGQWKVIHFNFGLHDINRKIDGVANLEGDVAIPAELYASNLNSVAAPLLATGATVLWADTTPIPEGSSSGRREGDEVRYNEIARAVMKKHGIAANDLYALVKARLLELQLPGNVHFNADGYRVLGERVGEVIGAALT